jgi:hypothetical protein
MSDLRLQYKTPNDTKLKVKSNTEDPRYTENEDLSPQVQNEDLRPRVKTKTKDPRLDTK